MNTIKKASALLISLLLIAALFAVPFAAGAENSGAITYEFEDYCAIDQLVRTSNKASGEGLVIAAQDQEQVAGAVQYARSNPEPNITFAVNMPKSDYYMVEYALGQRKDQNTSNLTVSIDGTVIGENSSYYIEDLAGTTNYPWSPIPLRKYQQQNVYLSAGLHMVTLSVAKPTNEKQPYLFCADYISFTPDRLEIAPEGQTRMEWEKYKDSVIISETDGSDYIANAVVSDGCSGGYYLGMDSIDKACAVDYVDIIVPIHVSAGGTYEIENAKCQGVSRVSMFVDSVENGAVTATSTTKDETTETYITNKGEEATRYKYYASVWAKAEFVTYNVNLSAGDHELIFRIYQRSDAVDVAMYLDYLNFTSKVVNVKENAPARIEMEDCVKLFSPQQPKAYTSSLTEGVKYIHIDTTSSTEPTEATIPMFVETAGVYTISYIASDVGTKPQFYVDGVALRKSFTSTKSLDSKDTTLNKYPYFGEQYHGATLYTFEAKLPAGAVDFVISLPVRSNGDIAIAMDYVELSLKEAGPMLSAAAPCLIEFEDYINDFSKKPGLWSDYPQASGGAFVYSGGLGTDPVTLALPIDVADTGRYTGTFRFGLGSHLSEMNVYLDSAETSPILTLNNRENGVVAPDYPKAATSLASNPSYAEGQKFFSNNYPAGEITFNLDVAAGSHKLIFVMDNRDPWSTNNTQVAFAADYMSFTKANSKNFAIQNGKAEAYVEYEGAFTGKALFALYNGKELVTVSETDITNQSVVYVTANADTTVTHAKVFLWNNTTDCEALTLDTEFTVE